MAVAMRCMMLLPLVAGRVVVQLTKPMQLTTSDILRESENLNSTLSPPSEIRAIVRHMGDPGTPELAHEVANHITWNVSRVTGVEPTGWQIGQGQVGCYDIAGANAFQANHQGNVFASWINTSSWHHTVGVQGGGPQSQVYTWFDKGGVRPWATKNGKGERVTDYTTRMAVEAWTKMPSVSGQLAAPNVSGSVGQIGLEFYVVDTISGKSFASGGAIWDSRPFGYQCGNEFVASDTFTPFASSPILPGMKYISAAPGSSFYFNGAKPLTDYKWFKYTVSASQLELATRDINARFPGTNISNNAADYEIQSVLWGNEVTGYFDHPMAYSIVVANLTGYVESGPEIII